MSVEHIPIQDSSTEAASDAEKRTGSLVQLLNQWEEEQETRQRLKLSADAVVEVLHNDHTLRIPRTDEDRANGFARWLHHWRERLEPSIQEELRSQLPEADGRLHPNYVHDLITHYVWPHIETALLAYAIGGLSRRWINTNLGDALISSEPEPGENGWMVSLSLQNHAKTVGRLALDREGNILADQSSSYDDILKQLDA